MFASLRGKENNVSAFEDDDRNVDALSLVCRMPRMFCKSCLTASSACRLAYVLLCRFLVHVLLGLS